MRQKVVLDTSLLLSLFEEKLSLEGITEMIGECTFLVPSAVIEELKRMRSINAVAALSLAETLPLTVTGSRGDEGVVEAAMKEGAVAVATNDAALAERLHSVNVGVISVMGRKRFGFRYEER